MNLRVVAQAVVDETIPQALDEYTEWRDWTAISKESFNALVDALAASEWIPVSEPPTKSGEYKAMSANGHIGAAYYHAPSNKWGVSFCTITHWRPLPEPPNGYNDDSMDMDAVERRENEEDAWMGYE